MAAILHPHLNGKMSGKCIRKSAVTKFRNLPAAVTSSISNRDLAQHMSHSDAIGDRFYNLLDIVKERGRTASFFKSTIMGQADKEPSAFSTELTADIKKRLIARFGELVHKNEMPSE